MADVKICDRCGKRLDDNRSTFRLTPEPAKRYILKVKLFRGKDGWGIPKSVETSHDLCIDCTGKLAEWLEFGNKKE